MHLHQSGRIEPGQGRRLGGRQDVSSSPGVWEPCLAFLYLLTYLPCLPHLAFSSLLLQKTTLVFRLPTSPLASPAASRCLATDAPLGRRPLGPSSRQSIPQIISFSPPSHTLSSHALLTHSHARPPRPGHAFSRCLLHPTATRVISRRHGTAECLSSLLAPRAFNSLSALFFFSRPLSGAPALTHFPDSSAWLTRRAGLQGHGRRRAASVRVSEGVVRLRRRGQGPGW